MEIRRALTFDSACGDSVEIRRALTRLRGDPAGADLRLGVRNGGARPSFEGDSVEIRRALTDLGVRNGGARPS